jgi:hypothetical protein
MEQAVPKRRAAAFRWQPEFHAELHLEARRDTVRDCAQDKPVVQGLEGLEDSAFSDEFCRFLQRSIPSVDAAEVLLALARDPGRSWQPSELAASMRPATTLSDGEAQRYLDQLQAAGLIAAGLDGRRQYRPADEALAGHVRMLAQAYKERPVTLFRVIYALRDFKIQSFADAFKLRRK